MLFAFLLSPSPERLRRPTASQSLLKLVLSAVTATRDYSIFGSEALQILVEYKWEGFARRMFVKEFVLFGVHLVITTVYTIQASAVHVRLPSTSK